MKCPKEGREVRLYFEKADVGFSCSEMKHEFVRNEKCRVNYVCRVRHVGCPLIENYYMFF